MNLERTYRFDCPACGKTLAAIGQPGPPVTIEAQKKHVIQYHLMTDCERRCKECDGQGVRIVVHRCPGPHEYGKCWTCRGVGWLPAPKVSDNVVMSDN